MRRRLLAALMVATALIGGAACSDGGDEDADTTEPETTETAAETDPAETDAETTTTAPAEETTTTLAELTSTVIQERMSEDHPDEAALVDWTIFRWVLGYGYTATVPEGTTPEQAASVCEGIAAVLDAHASEDAIAVVAGPDETDLAGRTSPTAACAAV